MPSFEKPYSNYYPANGAMTLTDGVFGTNDHHANWLGWSKSEMITTLSFPKDTLLQEVELGCLQNYASWIFFPENITVSAILKDGSTKELTTYKTDIKNTKGAIVNRVKLSFPAQKITKLKIPNTGLTNIRLDIGVDEGDEISFYYDPMIAKIISKGVNRIESINNMIQYLNELEYQNIKDYKIENLPEGNKPNNYGNYQGSMSNHDKVYENLIDVLNNGGSISTNAFEGLKTVEIIDKIYQSAKEIK